MGRFSSKNSFSTIDMPLWPTTFTKETIGIERNGVIIENQNTPSDLFMRFIPESLEAIKIMRLKGYNVVIFFNEPDITQNKITVEKVEQSNQIMLDAFGNHGIQSITGLFYSTSNLKEDIYSMPNNGMLKKAESDLRLKFKGGYFVGDKLHDLKVGDSVHCKPILLKQGMYNETKDKLNTFANRKLKEKTREFSNLLEFANSLK